MVTEKIAHKQTDLTGNFITNVNKTSYVNYFTNEKIKDNIF